MKLTKEEIKHIAQLARLQVDEKEVEYYSDELSEVLQYVKQLDGLDIKDIDPMAQATNLHSVTREDKQINTKDGKRASIVKNIMQAVPFSEKGYLKVKSVFNRKK